MHILSHNDEIHRNIVCLRKKPLLKEIYKNFYKLIEAQLVQKRGLQTVELGSGAGIIKEVIPNCITTDLFANPWVDRVENAYQLSFDDNSVSNLILFDVFHHLRYPGSALNEFQRVLAPQGRVIIFDPCMSILGMIVFGFFHHEELQLRQKIQMFAPDGWIPDADSYYAAQGNASRMFWEKKFSSYLKCWKIISKQKISAISYVASGGYSKLQLYPSNILFLMRYIDRLCDYAPYLFATRLLVVLEKKVNLKVEG